MVFSGLIKPVYRYYQVMFMFYDLEEVNTVLMTGEKERVRIGNFLLYSLLLLLIMYLISLTLLINIVTSLNFHFHFTYSRLEVFGPETKNCVTKIAFEHARFSGNFKSI